MKEYIHSKQGSQDCELLGCEHCAVADICTKYASDQGLATGGGLSRTRIFAEAGEHVYWAGDEFSNLYAVRSGCVKIYALDEDGNERIRGFYLPGDLLGLDSLYSDDYITSACAVLPTEVCAISYDQLTRHVAIKPLLQQRMLRLMSKDLATALALAGDYSAEQRMAAFLLYLHEREQARNIGQAGEVSLLMPRRDIANFLRLAPETASRVLGRFQQQGLITSTQKSLYLDDFEGLQHLARPIGIVSSYSGLEEAA